MDLREQILAAKKIMAGAEIPVMPMEVIEINQLFSNSEFPDAGEIVRIVERNMTLSGELIKAANTPGFSKKEAEVVKTVKVAIDVIGLQRLKNLITSLGFKGQINGEVYESILEHSVNVGKVAGALSEWVKGVVADEAYMAGLFHNAGAIILATKFEDYQKYFLNSITNCYSGVDRELERYKVSHVVYGLIVAKEWKLDKLYYQIILTHHQRDLSQILDEKARILVALIQLASCIVSQATFNNYLGSEVKEMYETANAELGIETEVINEIRVSMLGHQL